MGDAVEKRKIGLGHRKLRRWIIPGGLVLLILVLTLLLTPGRAAAGNTGWHLVIRQAADQETLYKAPIQPGDDITFHWVHSVEHFRWQEEILVTEQGTLMLVESRFEGFGAGIPHDNPGGVRVEDGWVILENVNREVEQYQWLHSHTALPEILLQGDVMLTGSQLPHHQALEMTIEKR